MGFVPALGARFALVGLVAGVVIGGALALGLAPGIWSGSAPHGTSSMPTAPGFSIGNPVGPTQCNLPLAVGCVAAGDYRYTISIEDGFGVLFSSIVYEVSAANGTAYPALSSGAFTYENLSGSVVAVYVVSPGGNLSVPNASDWTYYPAQTGVSGATPLSSAYVLVLDVGSVDPAGLGLELAATGVGPSTGLHDVLALP